MKIYHGKAWQRTIREQKAKSDVFNLFGEWWKKIDVDIKKAVVQRVSYQTAVQIIKEYEWLGSMAQRTTHCYGIFYEGYCGGVVCFAIPPTPEAGIGVCGKEYAPLVKTLARGACVHWAHPHSASKLIAGALNNMVEKTKFRIFTAYADTMAGEIGTVYQATNWIYTGKTGSQIEYFLNGKWRSGRTARHKSYQKRNIDIKLLPQRKGLGKGRYVWIGGNKIEKREIMKNLRYSILPYPKRDNKKYDAVLTGNII